jgi:nitrate reductase NapE component
MLLQVVCFKFNVLELFYLGRDVRAPLFTSTVANVTAMLPCWLDCLLLAVFVLSKMAVSWVVAPCRLTWAYQPLVGPYCIHHQGVYRSTDLWNICKLTTVYTALQPRRRPSSYSPPWEPQILLCYFRSLFVFPVVSVPFTAAYAFCGNIHPFRCHVNVATSP